MQREKATVAAKNRQAETAETRRVLDYQVGDLVQIVADGKPAAGRIGVIVGLRLHEENRKNPYGLKYNFAYTVKFSDTESIEVHGGRIRFLRHADDKI